MWHDCFAISWFFWPKSLLSWVKWISKNCTKQTSIHHRKNRRVRRKLRVLALGAGCLKLQPRFLGIQSALWTISRGFGIRIKRESGYQPVIHKCRRLQKEIGSVFWANWWGWCQEKLFAHWNKNWAFSYSELFWAQWNCNFAFSRCGLLLQRWKIKDEI